MFYGKQRYLFYSFIFVLFLGQVQNILAADEGGAPVEGIPVGKWLKKIGVLSDLEDAVETAATGNPIDPSVVQAQHTIQSTPKAIAETAAEEVDKIVVAVEKHEITPEQGAVWSEQICNGMRKAIEQGKRESALRLKETQEKAEQEAKDALELAEQKAAEADALKAGDVQKEDADRAVQEAREVADTKEEEAQASAERIDEIQGEVRDALDEAAVQLKGIQESALVRFVKVYEESSKEIATFKLDISVNILSLTESLKKLGLHDITYYDAVKILQDNKALLENHSVEDAEMSYLQGYLQSLVLIQQKKVASSAAIVPTIDLMRAIRFNQN